MRLPKHACPLLRLEGRVRSMDSFGARDVLRALPHTLHDSAEHQSLVEASIRGPHVRKRHLAMPLCVKDVLVHMMGVFHDGDAMHEVVLPVWHGCLLDGPIDPPVARRPDTPAMALAVEELAGVGARAGPPPSRTAEVLNAIAMWQVVLPRARIRYEVEGFRVGRIFHIVAVAIIEALHEGLIVIRGLVVEHTLTLTHTLLVHRPIIKSPMLVGRLEQVEPSRLASCSHNGVVLEPAIEEEQPEVFAAALCTASCEQRERASFLRFFLALARL
mmetsp:Transcript_92327/g.197833  ORF Transcript_92327/g.197833 Transcript_92327/m.197833 type:complete len:273 (-) Transcript_92327:2512-3330(-)